MATTAEEVWLLLGQLIESQKESEQLFKESKQEADRRARESERLFQESKLEADLRARESERLFQESKLEADLRARESERLFQESKQEADRRARESERLFQESKLEADLRTKDIDRQLKELGNQTRELGKQIGGLGKKFGSFTEGLALPSMERILQKQFGMEIISPSVRVSKGGLNLEIDVLAYANGDINTAYIVEVKSHPREESITQLKNLLERFRTFFPEHHNKKVHGILAAVDWSGDLKQQTLNEGLYVASIHDEVFELETPAGFQPRFW